MIGYLSGTVLKNDGKNLLLNVNGVGYLLTVPIDTAGLFALSKEAALYTHLHVREDEMSLYGFESEEKLSFFKLVLTVSGIGPKMGIELLSLPVNAVKQAIVQGDASFLTTVKGLGQKVAARLILELKNKIKVEELVVETGSKVQISSDVVDALENLGYDRNRIVKVLKDLKEPLESEEEVIKYALRHL